MKTKQNVNSSLMKNIFLLLLLISGMVEAQIVTIPDANFKAKLLSATPTNYLAKNLSGSYINIDANSDGEIQNSEAMQVSYLFLYQSNISDMTGIESFQNLTELICDNNNISSLNTTNLTNLRILRLSNNNFSSLDVSSLVNLTQLNCGYNQLTQLDLSNLDNLTVLHFENNLLSSINVSNMANLSQLVMNDNQINTIDLSANNNLTVLYCYNNQLLTLDFSNLNNILEIRCFGNLLTTLNFQNLTYLTYISCGGSALTQVDFVNLPSLNYLSIDGGLDLTSFDLNTLTTLTYLYVSGFGLTALNLSTLTNLDDFRISGTSFTSIDVSALANLSTIYFYGNPNLTTVDLSSNTNLVTTKFFQNSALTYINVKNGGQQDVFNMFFDSSLPSLRYVCADESEIEILQNTLNALYQPLGVPVSSYCSFNPGGDNNTITGNIKFDNNNNGCDAGDITPNNIRVNINDGTTTGASYINNIGNYRFYTQAGNFQIAPSLENPTWFNFSPTNASVPFPNNNNNTATQDFCIAANGIHSDIEVVISPVFFARPGFDATYQITYRNKGNQTVSGSVNLIFDDSKTDFVSANPLVDNLALNSLSWNYSNLLPFESRTITVTLNVNSPTETPAVNIGDVLNFEVTITPAVGDEIPEDNLFTYNQTVVGSYDPNDITCLEGDVVPATEIGKYLHYAINFENTGTFPAENVVVKTEVDAAKFDIGSLQLMNSNFPVDARITGNKVEFIFKNIQLPIGGHGHILLKIKTQNTLVTGDAVANRGDIFFDYNFPIDTGLANTVFQTLSNSVFEIDSSIAVYPNPAVNEVTIKADNKIKSIQLYDAQGRIILTSLTDDLESKLDISSYSKGIYFLKITTEKGAQVQKLLKD